MQADRETFHGDVRDFTPSDIGVIKETIALFPNLSRAELVFTICENLAWYTPSGGLKRDGCQKALVRLEARGILSLPTSRCTKARPQLVECSSRSDPEGEIVCTLRDLAPIDLRPATSRDDKNLWNELVKRHHPLGYSRPFGVHRRYFIKSRNDRRLGCFLVAGAAKSVRVRDDWIGWSLVTRRRGLHLIINNSRFLVFPWVSVKFLASHVLSLAARRIPDDWQRSWGYRPVLMETFVDPEFYQGACYRAAGWSLLGETAGTGRPRSAQTYQTTKKTMFVRPLVKKFRDRLLEPDETNTANSE
jgi:hypothetical protein